MASFVRYDIAEAHCVLEWDYNIGGWLPERPSNMRRRASTGVQLHRMRFRARPTLAYDTLTPNARAIYLERVLAWNLPRDDEQNRAIREAFAADWLREHYPAVHTELFLRAH